MWAGSDIPFLEYYVENYNWGTAELLMDYFRYPGLTTVLHPVAAVSPCDTYSLRLAVASSAFSISYLDIPGAAVFLDHLRSFGTAYDSCTTAGVSDLSRELGLAISPNPFTEQLRLRIGPAYTGRILQVTLTDITGRKLLAATGNVSEINRQLAGLVTGISSGVYFISVQDGESGQQQVYPVVKE